MASSSGPPPGLARPKSSKEILQPPTFSSPPPSLPSIVSPAPRRPQSASWASSLAAGLFPPTFELPFPAQIPQGIQPLAEAVHPAGCLSHPPLFDNTLVTDLAVFPAPLPSDPWHVAHLRVCAHASAACIACSAAFVCCSCRALRFTPGIPPVGSPLSPQQPGPLQRSRSASPALFRFDVGNGTPPPDAYLEHNPIPDDDDAYTRALAECDTCDNISCPRGPDEPATYSITVEQFDENIEESYDRVFRACSACNRSCKKNFMGCRIKSRIFDNSIRNALKGRAIPTPTQRDGAIPDPSPPPVRRSGPVPGSAAYAREHPIGNAPTTQAPPSTPPDSSLPTVTKLQDVLLTLSARPATPAAFVATVRVKHDILCSHPVSSCPTCSYGLICCNCKRLFMPAVARHLACLACKHVAFSCCDSATCCSCGKFWTPTDSILPPPAFAQLPAARPRGGAGSNTGTTSSPEPDIWTPSPRSSPDEIDDLTARANIPLPTSRSESDASRAPSRASSVDMPVNVAATPIPTPDYSSLPDDLIDGLMHPSFPDRALLDTNDKRHFLGRGDLSVTSLKLYARRIFTETSHWITAGHFLVDIFQGATINGSRDDFRRFVILVGTQLGYGDLAQSMSESLDVNRKMADEYMRLRDVATTWKQKAKANSKDARAGRKAQDELNKAQGDIALILEERDVFITQRNELLADIKRLNLELSRVHKDYGNAIDDNTKFAANVESLERQLADTTTELHHNKNALSMAEHHRNKAEFDLDQAVLNLDKAVAEQARNKAFYEARITALTSTPVPTSQPDSEAPLSAAAIDRSVLITRLESLKKELSARDAALMKLRSEVSLSDDVNTLRAELAEAKAVAARLSGMYEQKSKDFRDSELERLTLLGKQILEDSAAPKTTPPARPRPASRRGRQRSRSQGREHLEPLPSEASPPSSQPFWQDEPLFTKHVAAVTTATMSALPHLPFETAIASAFNTVRNVGPPPPLKLDKKPGNRRSGAPSPPTPVPAPAPQGNFTFADIAKAAVTNATDAKKKPSWRAIETSKALVLRPSTKGTRVSELHLKIPKTTASADLFKLKGSALLERVAKLINDHSEPAPRMALRENPLVFVKWSMRGNLVLKCAKPMDDLIKEGIRDAIAYFFPSPSAEIMILNKPPTTALKFLAVPRHNLDGSDTDEMDLLNDLTAHPAWADVELWSNPKFINLKAGMAGATVVVSVVDDNQGNVGRKLMGTMVDFSGCMRPCKRWVELPAQPFCGQCQSWGHPGARCPANVLICARCGGTHDFRQHDRYCETCKKGPGHACTPFCRNCRGRHMSTSHECPFWLGRTSKERHAELYAEIEAKFPKTNAKGDRSAGKKSSGRKRVGFSNPDAEGFIQVGTTPGIARIDTVPSGPPSPAPPASKKPDNGSIVGALADETLRPELRGNEEARRLMQETLLDEATFAAADAADSGSTTEAQPNSLNIEYA
ncbi:hypothetical protein AX14_003801 [Amanita brunnescens Koide BX004]|nr:hypothetical protein AX14_003801 [Amanita brunnescens Koide BX004]